MRTSVTALSTVVPWDDCDIPADDCPLVMAVAAKLGVSPQFIAERTHEVVIGVRQRTGERISVEAALESVLAAGKAIQARAMVEAKKHAKKNKQRGRKR